VAIFLEAAAAAAGDAHRTGGGDLAIDGLVKFPHLAAEVVGHATLSAAQYSNRFAFSR